MYIYFFLFPYSFIYLLVTHNLKNICLRSTAIAAILKCRNLHQFNDHTAISVLFLLIIMLQCKVFMLMNNRSSLLFVLFLDNV